MVLQWTCLASSSDAFKTLSRRRCGYPQQPRNFSLHVDDRHASLSSFSSRANLRRSSLQYRHPAIYRSGLRATNAQNSTGPSATLSMRSLAARIVEVRTTYRPSGRRDLITTLGGLGANRHLPFHRSELVRRTEPSAYLAYRNGHLRVQHRPACDFARRRPGSTGTTTIPSTFALASPDHNGSGSQPSRRVEFLACPVSHGAVVSSRSRGSVRAPRTTSQSRPRTRSRTRVRSPTHRAARRAPRAV